MKKILILSTLFFFMIQSVYATTYYDPNVQILESEESPIDGLQVEMRYPFYRVEKEYGDYVLKENQGDYLLDEEDVIYTSWNPTGEVIEKEGREYQEKTTYYVSRRKKVHYFYLYDVSGNNGVFQLSELSFYVNGEKLNVSYDCSCNDLQNGVIEETPYVMTNGSILKVNLNGDYWMEELSVHYALYEDGNNSVAYSMAFEDEDLLEEVPYYKARKVGYFRGFQYEEIDASSFCLMHDKQEHFESEEEVLEDEHTFVQVLTEYYFRDKLYHTYQEKKVYCEGYLKEGKEECPIKEEPGKLIYLYASQNKIIIKDSVVLYSGEWLEDHLVLYSDVPYEIRGEINYEESGIYEVEVITSFSDTFHLVEVRNYEKEMEELYLLLSEKQEMIEELEAEKEKMKRELEVIRKEWKWSQEKIAELQDLSFRQEEELKKKESERIEIQNTVEEKEQTIKRLEEQIQSLINESPKIEEKIIEKECEKEEIKVERKVPWILYVLCVLLGFLLSKIKKH